MLSIRTNSTPSPRDRSGFTVVELLLAIIAVPVVILGVIFINLYVPTLVLQSFGYDIDLYIFFAVNVAAGTLGLGYNLLGASRWANKDASFLNRLAKPWLAYLLHSILMMLIFGATGSEIGLFHILVAGLPMPFFWQTVRYAVRRIRAGRKTDESKLIIPDSADTN
jgi:hypothetical protein